MLRRALHNSLAKRFLYIPTRVRKPRQDDAQRLLQLEERELETKLRELRQHESALRKFLNERQEQETIGTLPSGAMSLDKDLAALEAQLSVAPEPTTEFENLFQKALPKSIEAKLEPGSMALLEKNWALQLKELNTNGGFTNISTGDATQFIGLIGLKRPENAHLTPQVDKMTRDAGLRSPTIVHHLMAGYATLGNAERVEELVGTVAQSQISFGHLAKAYFKRRDLSEVIDIIRRMESAGLKPTTPIYTMAIQSLVQHSQFKDAFTLFDNLKYLGTKYQPDTRMYNTMILAAAKTHNVNKALDLYAEMTTRAIDPLEPDQQTLEHLIYACSRDTTTKLKAWEFFLQLKNQSRVVTRDSMLALLYLCGKTGELVLMRKLIAKLCASPASYPDNFMINCLFMAYLNYDPSQVSALSTTMGASLRSELLQSFASPGAIANEDYLPPFLPTEDLKNEHIYAEARAMVEFFGDLDPSYLKVVNQSSATLGVPIVFNVLKIALERGTLADFAECWDKFTVRSREFTIEIEDSEIEPHANAITRGQDLYKLAIQAAKQFKSTEFADKIWRERGSWRKTPAFQSLDEHTRRRLDVGFAKEMVAFFTEIGDTESALGIVKSTVRQFRWRRAHLQPLLDLAAHQEDYDTVLAVRNILKRYWERENRLAEA